MRRCGQPHASLQALGSPITAGLIVVGKQGAPCGVPCRTVQCQPSTLARGCFEPALHCANTTFCHTVECQHYGVYLSLVPILLPASTPRRCLHPLQCANTALACSCCSTSAQAMAPRRWRSPSRGTCASWPSTSMARAALSQHCSVSTPPHASATVVRDCLQFSLTTLLYVPLVPTLLHILLGPALLRYHPPLVCANTTLSCRHRWPYAA